MMYEVVKAVALVTEEIDANIKRLEEFLGAGSAKTLEEYRETCGVIKGLLTARRYMTDLTKNMESHDD